MAKCARGIVLVLLVACGSHRPQASSRSHIVEECIYVPAVVGFRPAATPERTLQGDGRGRIVVRAERSVSHLPIDSAELRVSGERIAVRSGHGLVLDTVPSERVKFEIAAPGFVPAHVELTVRRGYADTVVAWLAHPALAIPCGVRSTL